MEADRQAEDHSEGGRAETIEGDARKVREAATGGGDARAGRAAAAKRAALTRLLEKDLERVSTQVFLFSITLDPRVA